MFSIYGYKLYRNITKNIFARNVNIRQKRENFKTKCFVIFSGPTQVVRYLYDFTEKV